MAVEKDMFKRFFTVTGEAAGPLFKVGDITPVFANPKPAV